MIKLWDIYLVLFVLVSRPSRRGVYGKVVIIFISENDSSTFWFNFKSILFFNASPRTKLF